VLTFHETDDVDRQTGLRFQAPKLEHLPLRSLSEVEAERQTPYHRGFYDGSRGLSPAYVPTCNLRVQYGKGFEEGQRERDKLNARPINERLRPE